MITITIRLFGVFKSLTALDTGITLSLTKGTDLSQLRQSVSAYFQKNFPNFSQGDLIALSAFANDEQILPENYQFEQDTELAILPPVCGG